MKLSRSFGEFSPGDRYFLPHDMFEFERYRKQIKHIATVKIQRAFRHHTARKYRNFLHAQATVIKRIYRGHRARKRVAEITRDRNARRSGEFFASRAVIIQKIVRGYLSRKNHQNFHGRKRFLEHVHNAGERLRSRIDELVIAHERQRNDAERERDAKNFNEIAKNISHLTGTKNVPGVFSSPFGNEFRATANGFDVEEKVREAFVANRSKRPSKKDGLALSQSPSQSQPVPRASLSSLFPRISPQKTAKIGGTGAQHVQPQTRASSVLLPSVTKPGRVVSASTLVS